MPQDKASILGVAINSSSGEELLNAIVDYACKDVIAKPSVIEAEAISDMTKIDKKGIASSPSTTLGIPRNDNIVVFTPNPEFLVEASRDSDFRDLLNKADINLPDGIGLVWASRILRRRNCIDSGIRRNDNPAVIKERISGADVVGGLLEIGNKLESGSEKWEVSREVRVGSVNGENMKKWMIGIAGARRGVLEESAELIKRLQEKYPNITFINLDNKSEILNPKYETNSNDQNPNDQNRNVLNLENLNFDIVSNFDIRISNFNVIFAAHGMKKQENWIWENKNKYNANVFMGIGGSLDFLGGFSKRAPKVVRSVGLEWLWRGLQRPTHFKRIWKATILFGWLVMKSVVSVKCKLMSLRAKSS